jgi:hypothetical protein
MYPNSPARAIYSDCYYGIVSNLMDPKRLGRVQINILGFTDEVPAEELPWATLQLGLGSGVDRGHSPAMQEGDKVMVRFQNADTRFPVIISGTLAADAGEVELPAIAVNGPRSTSGVRTTPAELPTSAANQPTYMVDETSKFHSILIQRRANQSYRVAHLAQGSQFEMTAGGDIVTFSPSAVWVSSSAEYHERYQTHTGRGTTSTTELSGPWTLDASRIELNSVAGTTLDAGGKLGLNGLSVALVAMDQVSLLSGGATSIMAGSTLDVATTATISMTSATGGISGKALLGEIVFSSAEILEFKLSPLEGFSLSTAVSSLSGNLLGGLKFEGPVASMEISAQGTVSLKNAMGELGIATTGGIELKNQMAALEISTAGQVTLKNQTGTLGEILKDLLTLLQRVTVQTGTGQSSPFNQQSELQMISRRLQQLLD